MLPCALSAAISTQCVRIEDFSSDAGLLKWVTSQVALYEIMDRAVATCREPYVTLFATGERFSAWNGACVLM